MPWPTWQELTDFIVTLTMCFVVLGIVFVLLAGLFNSAVDNNKIFEVLGPLLGLVVGDFIGGKRRRVTGKDDDGT